MIEDAKQLPHGAELRADLCIVGAGAAGISLALELIGSGLQVLVLESGGLKAERRTQSLYEGTVRDLRLHTPPDRYRQRRLGGTTTIWGGRCVPLDAIDFEPREFIANSGWPLGPEALAPYYPRANELCEAGDFAYTIATAFKVAPRPMIEGFVSENFSTDTIERFSRPTDFGARYREQLRTAANIQVLLHANVTLIQAAANGQSVASMAVRTLAGKRFTVLATRYVLATGGLETPRLLLASRDIAPQGLGNQHDVVGRYYMCHVAGTLGAIHIDRPGTAVWHGYDISDQGIYCRRRFALRPGKQRELRLGNFVARLHHPRITDPRHRNAVLSLLFLAKAFIPYEYAKRLHGDERVTPAAWLRHLGNVLRGPVDVASFAWHMLRDRRFASRKFPSIIIRSRANLYSLDFHSEQEPNPESRVTLGDQVDALGMPRIHIDWRYSARDIDTVARAIALLARDIEASGLGTFSYQPAQVEAEATRYGAYGGHHIGTARMGHDPRTSVVDASCRVHGISNLYVAGAALFPTSSQANPTLAVVALALRLADHLKTKAGQAG